MVLVDALHLLLFNNSFMVFGASAPASLDQNTTVFGVGFHVTCCSWGSPCFSVKLPFVTV